MIGGERLKNGIRTQMGPLCKRARAPTAGSAVSRKSRHEVPGELLYAFALLAGHGSRRFTSSRAGAGRELRKSPARLLLQSRMGASAVNARELRHMAERCRELQR